MHPSAAGPRLEVDGGIVEGTRDGSVESFKGIPFAAPPLGPLRWRAPQPVPAWTGVRDATRFGADPMQSPFAEDLAPLQTTPAEDCLFVNVWRPAGTRAGDRLPVLVWLYGGGFVNGGTSPETYHGDRLARAGIVFVSVNYRVGHFGFFAHPALSRLDADAGLLANYGHLDQLAGLRWVQRHAGVLGADAGKVTLIGESAGGGSVIALIASPLARGLVHQAIVMSGGGRGLLDGDRRIDEDRPGLPSGHTLGLRLARRHGIEGDGSSALDALRALPAAALARGLQIPTLPSQRDVFSAPMLDGRFLRDPGADIAAGRWARIPLMVGTTQQEVGGFAAESKAAAWRFFGDDAAAAERAFDPDGQASLQEVQARIGMTLKMHEPARHLARLVSAQGLPTYLYRFGYVAESLRAQWPLGAAHASEIPYFLGRLPADRTAIDRKVESDVCGYVTNFVKAGDPNGAALPRWERVEPGAERPMTIAADGACRHAADPLTERLDLVERHAEAR